VLNDSSKSKHWSMAGCGRVVGMLIGYYDVDDDVCGGVTRCSPRFIESDRGRKK